MSTLFSDNIYAGLKGIELAEDLLELGDGIVLKKTYAHLFAPFMMAFSPAPTGKHHPGPWKSSSGGFSFDVTAELHIPSNIEKDIESKISVARTLLFLIRLGVNPATTLVVFANYPFKTLAEIPDADVKIIPYEVKPRHFPLGVDGGVVDIETVSWVKEHWKTTHKLISESSEFKLAVEAIDTGQFIENHALILISLWGALEALFSPSTTELKFRVSSLIASFLEQPGTERVKRQKEIAKLYNMRSSAAHGKPNHDSEHLLATFNILREVLFKIIENGHVPDKAELEGMLFGVS